MTTLTLHFTNEEMVSDGRGGLTPGLFKMGETGCEECPKYAVGLFASVDDEGLFAYCYEHMAAISPLAAIVLLGCDAVERGREYTDLQLMVIDELGICPQCGEGLDTGAGFGMRDLECSNFGEDAVGDEDCGWSGSYPLALYREKLMPKYLAGRGGEGQQLVAKIVQEKGIPIIPVMEPRQ